MLKNKEDDFLGDTLTNNVKYADNEWQAHGTVDRGSTYTKESILHLLFEGFNYDRNLGDYKNYVPRASTSEWSRDGVANPYVSAKLQHDLYVLDTLYYTSTTTQSVKNIFDIPTYLKRGIAISNPVYDSRASYDIVRVIDENDLSDSWTVGEFIDLFNPDEYVEGVQISEGIYYKPERLINRYINGKYTVDGVDTAFKVSLNVPSNYDNIRQLTLKSFLEQLGDTTNKVVTDVKKYTGKTPAEWFLNDFQLHLHDIDTIKMPFNKRGSEATDTTTLAEDTDIRTYLTRFTLNSITKSLIDNPSQQSVNYLESLNDLVEELIFANITSTDGLKKLYDSRADDIISDELRTSKSLARDILLNDKIYSHLFDKDSAQVDVLESFVKALDNLKNRITLYLPDVYIGYNATDNDPRQSWGIHYINEEDSENFFQDTDKSYKLYNNVLLGYRLADSLITTRTFLGGVFYHLYGNTIDSNTVVPINVPLNKTTAISFLPYKADLYNFYPTISILNNLYIDSRPEKTIVQKTVYGTVEHTETTTSADYNFAFEIKHWLENECFLYKGQVYGDYVEELNFLQDLTPDSNVQFKNIRVKKTEIPYKRFQDSKYEVPYVEQTNPLLNSTPENKKGIGVYGSDALASIGNLKGAEIDEKGNKTQNVFPPFIYDYDKGDQENLLATVVDPRQLSVLGEKQRINSKSGGLVIEDRIISPTIDELWTFLKYLTESDGSQIDKNVNERLPQFFGVKKSFISNTLNDYRDSALNTLNPRYADKGENVVDILSWIPTSPVENRVHWGSTIRPELQFGGYTVTRYIEKVYDYRVLPFSRRKVIKDNAVYEFNTEELDNYNNTTGYLEKLYNSAILSFDLLDLEKSIPKVTLSVDPYLLEAHVLEESKSGTVEIFSHENDNKLITTNEPVHNTVERLKAFKNIARILKYHSADGSAERTNANDTLSSYHNHYKKYLDNPKNLKEIERDLETIRQNLQTLAEFMVSTYVNMGYADRAKNRGTLHQLHKNAYDYLSTWLVDVNNTIADSRNSTYNTDQNLAELTDSLNYLKDTLAVIELDKKVVFEDGEFVDRYRIENYDHFVIDLNSDPRVNTRHRHPMYRPNETLLSEVYLAADGTWRSIHEHMVLPVIFDEH